MALLSPMLLAALLEGATPAPHVVVVEAPSAVEIEFVEPSQRPVASHGWADAPFRDVVEAEVDALEDAGEAEVELTEEFEVQNAVVEERPSGVADDDSVVSISSPDTVGRQVSEPYSMIRKVGTDTWTVDPILVDIYTHDLHAADCLAKALPHHDARGKTDGFFIAHVVDDSPLHQAGIRSGDIVHAVNDSNINGVVRALLVLRKLRKAEQVEITLTRDGERITQRYVVPR